MGKAAFLAFHDSLRNGEAMALLMLDGKQVIYDPSLEPDATVIE